MSYMKSSFLVSVVGLGDMRKEPPLNRLHVVSQRLNSSQDTLLLLFSAIHVNICTSISLKCIAHRSYASISLTVLQAHLCLYYRQLTLILMTVLRAVCQRHG